MGDLKYNPNDYEPIQIGFGTMADFVSGLTADPSAPDRPSLSDYFTEHGVNAGLAFHEGPMVFAEANAWTFNERLTPEDGMGGQITQRHGELNFGIQSNLNDEHVGYVRGEYSVTFGNGSWTPPASETFEYPVFDDEGNEIGMETETVDFDGFHDFDGPVTTLSLIGSAYTDGTYHMAGIAEHDRTISIGGRDFDINALGAIGLDNDMGAFATAQGEIKTLVHAGSGTSLYGEASVLVASDDAYSHQYIGGGVETSILQKIPGIGSALPPVRTGVQYDGDSVNPAVSVGWNF